MAGGFYRDSSSLTRSLQTSFSEDAFSGVGPSHPSQWQPNQMTSRHAVNQAHNSFDELFQRIDNMTAMISSTQKLVFDQQASQKELEEKVDQLANDVEKLRQAQVHATIPDCTISGGKSRVKVPFEVSVCVV